MKNILFCSDFSLIWAMIPEKKCHVMFKNYIPSELGLMTKSPIGEFLINSIAGPTARFLNFLWLIFLNSVFMGLDELSSLTSMTGLSSFFRSNLSKSINGCNSLTILLKQVSKQFKSWSSTLLLWGNDKFMSTLSNSWSSAFLGLLSSDGWKGNPVIMAFM